MIQFQPVLRLAAATTLLALTGCHAIVTQKNLTVGDFQTLTGSIQVESSAQSYDRYEAVLRAPSRGPRCSVEVAMLTMDVDADLAMITSLPYADSLREQLGRSDRIKLLGKLQTEELVDLAHEAGVEPPLPVDLIVESFAFTTDTYIVPGFDGNPLATPMLVLEAHIHSAYDGSSLRFEERGPLARNREVLKRFNERVRKNIEEKVGPELPIDIELRAPHNRPHKLQRDDFGTWR